MKKIFAVLICVLFAFDSVCAFAECEKLTQRVYTLTFGEPSESGYSDYKWLDENGSEVQIDSVENYSEKGLVKKRTVLPTQYNSVDSGFVTEVKDQGISGSCWAFSFMSAAESNLLTKSDDPFSDNTVFDFSEAHHVWFTHNSLVNDSTDPTSGDGVSVSSPYNNGGNWLRSTFSLARGMGFADEEDFPFYENDLGAMGNYNESSRYVGDYRLVDSYTIPSDDVQAIKEKIMANGCVTAAFYLSNSFLTKSVGNWCYYCPNEYATNHQISIVGWDDSYSVDNFRKENNPTSAGAWIVKNSYGTSWGNEGFFYLSYYDRSIDNFHALNVEDGKKYENAYQYDGYGYGTGISALTSDGESVKTLSFANVFTAKDNENINSVSFYTINQSADYTVDIYTSLPDSYATPVYNGTCVLSQSGSFDYSGYHTVKLNEETPVRKGEIFSVVVTLTADEGAFIPVEGQSGQNDGSYVRYYSSSLKQSYYRLSTSSSWQDASSKGYNNVCVKAFTSTPDDVYIGNAQQLAEFSESVRAGKTYKGKTVRLTDNIDMTGVTFSPIGDQTHLFDGTFDGNGKVISNLTLDSQNCSGFFGATGENSVIKYLGLENVCVSGNDNVGALVGKSQSKKIYNCYSSGEVSGNENVGGLIGYNSSASTDNCFSVASVTAQNMYGSFVGFNDSSYTNCYASSSVEPVGNHDTVGSGTVTAADGDQFKNGYVAYMLDSAGFVWTKGADHPVLSDDSGDDVHLASVYVIDLGEFSPIYLTQYEDLIGMLEEKYDGYACSVYTDYACRNEFSGQVTFDRTLFARLQENRLILSDGSSYSIEDGLLMGIAQGTTVLEVIMQFENADVLATAPDGKALSADDVIATGCKLFITSKTGEIVDEVTAVIFGDVNSDGYVDAFDLSVICCVVNFETEFDQGGAFEKAADLNPDGFIDAFDLSIMTSAVNYEIEI